MEYNRIRISHYYSFALFKNIYVTQNNNINTFTPYGYQKQSNIFEYAFFILPLIFNNCAMHTNIA